MAQYLAVVCADERRELVFGSCQAKILWEINSL